MQLQYATEEPRRRSGSGSIHKHMARDGTVTWRVRLNAHLEGDPRWQPQRTFATREDAEAGLERMLDDLAAGVEPEPRVPRRILTYGFVPVWVAPTIYFVLAPGPRAIKIGYTQNVPERVRGLQAANAERLRLVALASGDRSTEAALHRRFARLRVRGEWYATKRPLRLYIERHALCPFEYYGALCPGYVRTLLGSHPDVFGSEDDWLLPAFPKREAHKNGSHT